MPVAASPIREKERMAADERRLTPMKTNAISAFIGVHRRPILAFSVLKVRP
jgi:hypothetical protein